MTRMFALVALLAALAVGGYLFSVQSRKEARSGGSVTQVESEAVSAAVGTNFQGAAQVLQGWFAANGTYAGATLPPGSGVVLARADQTGYCVEASGGPPVEHELGPGGSPLPGPC